MTIKEKKDGTFMLQGTIGKNPLTGKYVRITRHNFKDRKEAELEFYRLKLEFQENGIEEKPQKYRFKEVYDLWLEQYQNTVKESTLNKTLTIFKTHILPEFKDMYIDMIKINHCQTGVNKWYRVLKNYKIVNNYCGLVFKYAIKKGIIKENPTLLVEMPIRKEDVEDDESENFYTKEEIKEFLDTVRINESPKWYALFRSLAFTGCRKGEILALTWNDINFSDNTIRVNKTLTTGLGNKLIVQTPKTKKSKRILPMDSLTMNILKEWKTAQAREMLICGFNTLNPEQIVFTNTLNSYINPQKIGQKIESICNKNNLKVITPHGFRHTHCSLLLESGVTIKEVQDRLGHSDIQTTMNIYAHVSQNKKDETISKFAKYIQI